jgi:hypothetical protein
MNLERTTMQRVGLEVPFESRRGALGARSETKSKDFNSVT